MTGWWAKHRDIGTIKEREFEVRMKKVIPDFPEHGQEPSIVDYETDRWFLDYKYRHSPPTEEIQNKVGFADLNFFCFDIGKLIKYKTVLEYTHWCKPFYIALEMDFPYLKGMYWFELYPDMIDKMMNETRWNTRLRREEHDNLVKTHVHISEVESNFDRLIEKLKNAN